MFLTSTYLKAMQTLIENMFLNLQTRLKTRKGFTKTEAVDRRCSVKKIFLKISQNPQESTCTGVSF